MEYRPPTHGILTPLPMVYQILSCGIMNPSLVVEMGGVNLPWGGSKYNDKKYHRKIDPGVNLPWGSKYHMTPGFSGEGISQSLVFRVMFIEKLVTPSFLRPIPLQTFTRINYVYICFAFILPVVTPCPPPPFSNIYMYQLVHSHLSQG